MSILYLFYKLFKVENPNATVWLIEDEAPAYANAACRFEGENLLFGIKK